MADDEPTLAEQIGRQMGETIAAGLNVMARQIRSLHPDPWDSCLDVDPFTGQPDHQHGDAQHEHGDGCIEKECCE